VLLTRTLKTEDGNSGDDLAEQRPLPSSALSLAFFCSQDSLPLSLYLFFSLFFVRGFYFSSVFGPSFFSLFFCFVFFLFFFLFLLPLLATTPSPFIRPKSVVTAGLLNAL
jgi:hypothetical protein